MWFACASLQHLKRVALWDVRSRPGGELQLAPVAPANHLTKDTRNRMENAHDLS